MKRLIKKVAVLGSGTMGAQIACHFANIGLEVLLLDIVPNELTDKEKEKDLSLDHPKVRNRIARENLDKTLKMDPSPIFDKSFASQIETGNFEDDLAEIQNCEWVLEAIVEKLDIKQDLFKRVEKYRNAGTIVTTNTSGIPIHDIAEGRSEDFKAHFCGTHFFNPPRYLQLLEIIPHKETDQEVVDFLQEFGDLHLGKTTIRCKDTPAFIGNRIGVYAIMLTIRLMRDMGLTIEQVDELTGKAVGRPKTATFRTADLVGLDVLADVTQGLYDRLEDDEEREVFKLPEFMKKMLEKGWKGDKVNQGFYKKEKENGKTQLYTLQPDKMEYRKKKDPEYLIIEEQKKQGSLEEQLKSLENKEISKTNFFKRIYLHLTGSDNDDAVEFFQKFYYRFFAYCSKRIPEIADNPYEIDQAIEAGFNWTAGPFRIWDMLGVKETLEKMEKAGHESAPWVHEMVENGYDSFYKNEEGKSKYYDIEKGEMQVIPRTRELIFLDNYREGHTVWKNDSLNIIHIGDGVLVAEFKSKRNTINLEVMEGIDKAIDLAENEDEYKALIIGNEDDDFSLGADIGMIGKNAVIRNKSKIEDAIKKFQELNMRIRYSKVPVIAAPRGKTLGGGCEICLHADHIQAAAETYIGLVEVGVGLIPAGGGCAQMARRATMQMIDEEPDTGRIQQYLLHISKADVSRSPEDAYVYGYFDRDKDRISMNKHRVLTDAKQWAVDLAEDYRPPVRKENIRALGKNALSFFYTAIANQRYGDYISDYDQEIVRKLAYTLVGGELTKPQMVKEEYILKLEREAFLELVTNFKTLERIGSVIFTGKPKRN